MLLFSHIHLQLKNVNYIVVVNKCINLLLLGNEENNNLNIVKTEWEYLLI